MKDFLKENLWEIAYGIVFLFSTGVIALTIYFMYLTL
jgi:hypothetical protein